MNIGFVELKLKLFYEFYLLVKYLVDGFVFELYFVGDIFKDFFIEVVYNFYIWKENIFYFDGMLNCLMDKFFFNMEV